jgi:hypothetical protein
MWRNLVIMTAAAGLSLALAGGASAQRMGMGNGIGVRSDTDARVTTRIGTTHFRAGLGARAEERGPNFRPPGWNHGMKTGWHCRVGARTCIPPGLR